VKQSMITIVATMAVLAALFLRPSDLELVTGWFGGGTEGTEDHEGQPHLAEGEEGPQPDAVVDAPDWSHDVEVDAVSYPESTVVCAPFFDRVAEAGLEGRVVDVGPLIVASGIEDAALATLCREANASVDVEAGLAMVEAAF